MGFFQRAAERSEAKVMGLVADAIEQFTDLDYGEIQLPCHILAGEIHRGWWVGLNGQYDETDDSYPGGWIGVYRCQSHFWGVTLDKADMSAVLRSPDALVGRQLIAALQGSAPTPVDFGGLNLGAPSLAAALTTIPYRTLVKG